MGSNSSKSNAEVAAVTQNNELDNNISTTNCDPRSPTPEITRTPLQYINGAKHNITKNADLRKKFENENTEETKLIHKNPILSAVIKNHLQSYDPRSPSQDFERSPITLNSKIEYDDDTPKKLMGAQIENNSCGSPCLKNDINENNCDDSLNRIEISPDLVVPRNLCNGFYDMSLNNTIKDDEEPLESSTACNEIIENDTIKGCENQEFLETNFDYIVGSETDEFKDSVGSAYNKVEVINHNEKLDYDVKNLPLYKIVNKDPRSPTMGIDRTPILVAKVEKDDNVEDMSDDSLIKVLQTKTDFDCTPEMKSDEIHIYEDDMKSIDTPNKPKSENSSGSRTPLSCMKNKTDSVCGRSKSTNTLYDSKTQKASKLHKMVSHIPRLKSLTQQSKYMSSDSSASLKHISKAISGDCENTPPHSHRDRWDKDSSILL